MQMLGGPLGLGTRHVLNHNYIYAAHTLMISKHVLLCLCLRQVLRCKTFLRVFLIFVLVRERRTSLMAAILQWRSSGYFMWMEWELNCGPYECKPLQMFMMSFHANVFCSLRSNLKATRNCTVTFVLRHECLESKTIIRACFCRDDHKTHTFTAAGGERLFSN